MAGKSLALNFSKLGHANAFSDCLWREFSILMYCDLLTKKRPQPKNWTLNMLNKDLVCILFRKPIPKLLDSLGPLFPPAL